MSCFVDAKIINKESRKNIWAKVSSQNIWMRQYKADTIDYFIIMNIDADKIKGNVQCYCNVGLMNLKIQKSEDLYLIRLTFTN